MLDAQLRRLCERVQHVELEGRPREAALLELTRHGDRLFRRRRNVLSRGRAPPGVGAGSTVLEDAPREHETALALGAQLLERLVLPVELRLDVGLAAGGPDHRGVGPRAEQQADRLRENRLAGAGLAGDRVQARREVELGLPDEDEVLDAQAAEHDSDCRLTVGGR